MTLFDGGPLLSYWHLLLDPNKTVIYGILKASQFSIWHFWGCESRCQTKIYLNEYNFVTFSLKLIALTVYVISTTCFEYQNQVLFKMTVFDGRPSLSHWHLFLVSKQKRRFWNTSSKSIFNMTLFEGAPRCQTKTENKIEKKNTCWVVTAARFPPAEQPTQQF